MRRAAARRRPGVRPHPSGEQQPDGRSRASTPPRSRSRSPSTKTSRPSSRRCPVVGPDGTNYQSGQVSAAGGQVSTAVSPLGPAGGLPDRLPRGLRRRAPRAGHGVVHADDARSRGGRPRTAAAAPRPAPRPRPRWTRRASTEQSRRRPDLAVAGRRGRPGRQPGRPPRCGWAAAAEPRSEESDDGPRGDQPDHPPHTGGVGGARGRPPPWWRPCWPVRCAARRSPPCSAPVDTRGHGRRGRDVRRARAGRPVRAGRVRRAEAEPGAPDGRTGRSSSAGGAWLVLALLGIAFRAADGYDRPVTALTGPDVLAWATEPGRRPGRPAHRRPAPRRCSAARSPGCAIRAGPVRIVLVIALLGMLTPGVTGHASSSASHEVAVTTVALHVAAASLWVGGLAAILVLLGRRRDAAGGAAPVLDARRGLPRHGHGERRADRAGPARVVGGAVLHRLRRVGDRQGVPRWCCSASWACSPGAGWPPAAYPCCAGRAPRSR